jgi:UDP-3-O-[3-hydroxymyristoyl] glucosamine N-acyltransferase
MQEYLISEIADFLDGKIIGDSNIKISQVAKIEEAKEGDISFIANPKYFKFAATTKASAIIVSLNFDPVRNDLVYIKVPDPYVAFLKIIEKIELPNISKKPLSGIHPTAIVPSSAKIGQNVFIGPYVVLGEDTSLGDDSIIHAGTFIGDNSTIGSKTLIYPNVVIRERCKIGSGVIIHPGVVIGSDGFGFAPKKDSTYEKLPQLGGVIIEDDVEIGSNTTIDRATLGNTLIKKGTKLDNLIQIAHNVVIGENTVIAAQSGISGSTKIGNNCMFGGQIGIVGHIEIADKVSIGAQSGISKTIKQPGIYFGSPAKEHMEAFRIEGAIKQLPELLREFRELKKHIEELEKKNNP